MGKRSNFDRIPRDFYETPYTAVLPLLPHIIYVNTFIEPCVGNGKLLGWLEAVGKKCLCKTDIFPSISTDFIADATDYLYSKDADIFITNPPWDRSKKNGEILHKIIENLSSQKPTWLLFDADWCHTRQSSQYMKYCIKVVSVGRVQWFEDSAHTGKDNVCWYLFDKNWAGKTQFVGRR